MTHKPFHTPLGDGIILDRSNKSKNDHAFDQYQLLLAQIQQFGQEKDSMLCTIACLVKRLGGTVLIGQDDAEFIKLWQKGLVNLNVDQNSIHPNFQSFIFSIVIKEEEKANESQADQEIDEALPLQ
jgi:hypothetical protein